MMIRSLSRCVLLLAALVLPGLASASPTSLYVFGDSLSDSGNLYVATAGAVPQTPPYFNGRFSNGLVWADQLATMLGAGTLTPSLLGGTNYAMGGATALSTGPVINLPQQVGLYLGGLQAPAGSVFALWAGANDVLTALANAPATVGAVAQSAAMAVVDAANTLVTLRGAKEMLILTLPDLGSVPRTLGVSLATQASQAFNTALLGGLASSAVLATAKVHILDMFALINEAVADPAAFGFTNVTQACLTASTICGPDQASQNRYLFWDSLHPTNAAHTYIAEAAMAVLPEPAAVLLFAVALAALLAVAGARQPRLRRIG